MKNIEDWHQRWREDGEISVSLLAAYFHSIQIAPGPISCSDVIKFRLQEGGMELCVCFFFWEKGIYCTILLILAFSTKNLRQIF